MPGFNLPAARALLDEAGWKDSNGDGILEKAGRSLNVVLTYEANSMEKKLLSEVIQGALKDIGVKLVLRPVEMAALGSQMPELSVDND